MKCHFSHYITWQSLFWYIAGGWHKSMKICLTLICCLLGPSERHKKNLPREIQALCLVLSPNLLSAACHRENFPLVGSALQIMKCRHSQVATADHFESRSEDEDEYDLGEMETEAEEERDIFEMPLMSSVVGRAQQLQRPGL